jgi:hypothetical protein
MSTVICNSPYIAVDVFRTKGNRVRLSSDVGALMGLSFELPADKAEELGRKLLELAQAAQQAKAAEVTP